MNPKIDNRAKKQWNNSDVTLNFHFKYINEKKVKFNLEYIDLILVSNFKGGNATINYKKNNLIESKLIEYSKLFKEIDSKYENKSISEITQKEFENLKEIILKIANLCYSEEFKISGFKASYLSALLNIYFPKLIPILDRRILINLNLIGKESLDTQFQVKNIQKYYESLLNKVREISKNNNKPIREIDKEYFIIELPSWAKKQKNE